MCRMNYKEALKEGFYEVQSARDWYREMTTTPLSPSSSPSSSSSDVIGMHAELLETYIKTATLLLQPIAPHFAEHMWSTLLGYPTSVQKALWSDIPVATPFSELKGEEKEREEGAVEAGLYMRATAKSVRDAEISLQKKSKKGAAAAAALPGGNKAVKLVVATTFPPWQDSCIAVIKDVLGSSAKELDDAKLKQGLAAKGLLKDKRVMPYVQIMKVRCPIHFNCFAAILDWISRFLFLVRGALPCLCPG